MMGNYPKSGGKGKVMGTTKKLRKISKGKALHRGQFDKVLSKGGNVQAANKVSNGTRLQKVFRAMVQNMQARKQAGQMMGQTSNPQTMPAGPMGY